MSTSTSGLTTMAGWGVVTLDSRDRAVRAVVGFAAPQLADEWARTQPGIDARVLPTEWTGESDWAVVALDSADRPTQIIAEFGCQQEADRHARSLQLSGYTVVPIDHPTPPSGRRSTAAPAVTAAPRATAPPEKRGSCAPPRSS
ncbi:hypothetical protein Ga0074812_14735 [Parafrankia irregularis]|uniref:Uncharacterized protein n=1 Tax=Parafrankia irregularis TaxID=795642 RepID=A0A0S4QYY7_9ACTN|nr:MULTISPECIES: hypothetical protein [Parafrankia]MBE3206652.1 hypothetical protein [Parafrankia sp. CH37]CUU60789.1 hypothetical protein Ga0074812_14735 [Parafrankia irregularis]